LERFKNENNELEKTMTTNSAIHPYLFFDGRCEEAIEFYRKAIGAEQEMLMRFKDAPPDAKAQHCSPPNSENKVMHASIRIGQSTIMLSDGRCTGHPKFEGFSLSLTSSTPVEAERLFAALSEGGNVQSPLTKTFFSPAFGMVRDKFGVMWTVYVASAH
jgi:PhnB protein